MSEHKGNILHEALGSDDDQMDDSIRVNRKYASKFIEKKKKEEYNKVSRRLAEEEEEEEEDSESEDSDGALITPSIEKSFLELLPKLRAKSKDIYKNDKNYFPQYEELVEEAKQLHTGEKEDKPFKMKDYVRESVLKKMDTEKSGEDDDSGEDSDLPDGPTPHEELMQIKKSFAQKIEDEEDSEDDDFLVIRGKSKDELEKEEEDFKQWEISKKATEKLNPKKLKSIDSKDLLSHFWSANDAEDDNDSFLRKYIINEGWIDKDRDRIPSYNEIINDDDEDMKDIEKQEKFEEKYNFRFEEPGGTEIVSHPREIEDSVRRKSDKRKRKREQRKLKKENEKLQKKEELKRLKNIKKQEIMEKMEEIQKITQNKKVSLHKETLEKLLEGDYDPEQYDKEMENLFADEYYDDEYYEDEKPFFDDEEEPVKLPKKKKKKDITLPSTDDPNTEKIMDKFVDEYYNLDYEDIVGDTPFRFGYQKVKPDTFGLDIMEILEADEKDLNSYLPLKQLAPYRRQDPKPRHSWKRKRREASLPDDTANEPPKKKRKNNKKK